MPRKTGIGYQNFEEIIRDQVFYIDKTSFIREWWESKDRVTLITRPRRFGKTLTMSMIEYFFSVDHKSCTNLFENLSVYTDSSYRELQGTWPVIALSFANVKETNWDSCYQALYEIIAQLYNRFSYLLDSDRLLDNEKTEFQRIMNRTAGEVSLKSSIHNLSGYLCKYHNKKVIILLDEYDTPMQEAYIHGYWDKIVSFTRGLFNAAFKTNPYLERGLMTGITRVSRESVFSDLNNLVAITTTSTHYMNSFGFTDAEVLQALNEYQLSDQKDMVRQWYDGFTFGTTPDIYNPWSVLNFLNSRRFSAYWANTSSNSLIGKLLQTASASIKTQFEQLMNGTTITAAIDEQIVYDQLDQTEDAIWSLLLASGYLKVVHHSLDLQSGKEWYELALTNQEVQFMFNSIIRSWFSGTDGKYNEFVQALLKNDKKAMNAYMNKTALASFSFFDTGKRPSEDTEPERFYHGVVLGLIVDLRDQYIITSNRESGFGRYDVILEPRNKQQNAFILEFKVHDPGEEATLADTVASALQQIEEKQYAADLEQRGIPSDQILKLGFAFEGKHVLIG